mgnify:CR=1 FL=1
MMVFTRKDLHDAIDKNSYKETLKILRESSKGGQYLIDNTCSHDNTLVRSIKSILSSTNLQGFGLSPKIIELLFEYGAKCVDGDLCNTLNIGIFWADSYIRRFKKCKREHQLVAEKNALTLLDVLVKNGAMPRNNNGSIMSMHSKYSAANTLSILMDLKNLKILRFMIDNTCLGLRPNNSGHQYNAFECAVEASKKTGHSDFIEVALVHGAIPHSVNSILFYPDKIRDYIAFGGDQIIRYLHQNINDLMAKLCTTNTMSSAEISGFLEMIVCASGSVTMPRDYFDLIGHSWCMECGKNRFILRGIINDYHQLWSGRYMFYDENDNNSIQDYQRIIELKQRLSAIQQIITDKRNCRKTETENLISGLPICCTDMIHGYDNLYPELDLIDWSKY